MINKDISFNVAKPIVYFIISKNQVFLLYIIQQYTTFAEDIKVQKCLKPGRPKLSTVLYSYVRLLKVKVHTMHTHIVVNQ